MGGEHRRRQIHDNTANGNCLSLGEWVNENNSKNVLHPAFPHFTIWKKNTREIHRAQCYNFRLRASLAEQTKRAT